MKIDYIVLLIALCSSCQSPTKQVYDKELKENSETHIFEGNFNEPTTSIYDYQNYISKPCLFYEKHGILFRDCIDSDLMLIPSLNDDTNQNNKNSVVFAFSFYNYGGDICINNHCKKDIFSDILSEEIELSIFEPNEIQVRTIQNDSKYGKWGYASAFCQGKSYNNIIITPLALEYIEDNQYDDFSPLVFVRFSYPSKSLYKEYIFKGDYKSNLLIQKNYNLIRNKQTISLPAWDNLL